MRAIEEIFASYEGRPLGVERFYAVLLPLVEIAGQQFLLYEVRAAHISQAGDAAFPGGRLEDGETFRQAAIRETVEEIGIAAEKIKILGEMDYFINHKRAIASFVARLEIDSLADLSVNTDEVERVFLIPLDYLMAQPPQSYEISFDPQVPADFPYDSLPKPGKQRIGRQPNQKLLFYHFKDEVVWGMTAQLTKRFIDIIQDNLLGGAS
ncbi:hypothetical protein AWM75_04970 [Aerococcus urinaehominis]|uniref:Uncharacterized protein n=1 Tax=Aerococcus urinaehominis TaxID=128944 RepID=A0A0X8FMI0_9LACT|nr:CoA pyrophosphatase [Aerococcus urinaehominis]AMB99382.1 hypothetical protein AWM75_04970 [Aerococcus urinaehominis]SDM23205.1 NUDIX domain-containing protein [Aerococcus urinaehominis]